MSQPPSPAEESAANLIRVCCSMMTQVLGPVSPADKAAISRFTFNLEPMIADALNRATQEATEKERERCAKVAESYRGKCPPDLTDHCLCMDDQVGIAQKIRESR